MLQQSTAPAVEEVAAMQPHPRRVLKGELHEVPLIEARTAALRPKVGIEECMKRSIE
jgi:hypothetical protein